MCLFGYHTNLVETKRVLNMIEGTYNLFIRKLPPPFENGENSLF
jgi:hypothetical protein